MSARTAPTANPEDPALHPWVGLRPFDEEDQDRFFGRAQEIDELVRTIQREALTIVFGPSGVGKSSLLAAGAFPRLRAAGFLPVPLRWDPEGMPTEPVRTFDPQVQRCAAEAGLEVQLLDTEPGAEPLTLWEYAHRLELWNERNELVTPVFVLDQFEEAFTLGEGRADVHAHLEELADLVENHIPPAVRARLEARGGRLAFDHTRAHARVVFALREDFVARLDGLRKSMPSVMRNRLALGRLGGENALAAVRRPAPELVDEPVAREIVRFVAAAERVGNAAEGPVDLATLSVEPALLSMICRELNTRRLEAGGARLTVDLVARAKDEILRTFYQRSFVGLPKAARRFVEESLLTPSGYRRSVPTEDAESAGLRPAHLKELIDRRLLRIEHRLARPHVELTHDVLARVVHEGQEARKRRRRLRLAGLIGLAVLLLAGLSTTIAILAVTARKGADAILILSAPKILKDLDRDARELWPPATGNRMRYEDWLARAKRALIELGTLRDTRPTEAIWEQLDSFSRLHLASDGRDAATGRWGIQGCLAYLPELETIWTRAQLEISKRYEGLALPVQRGLVPIGPDPDSGLWEFAHLETGWPPERGADGKLVMKEETGLVFVLLPGGTFWMGASADPNGQNYDTEAQDDESPPHEVPLSPFFLSKYEMTQGQWLRVASRNPSANLEGETPLLFPVENVSWVTCNEILGTLDLSLPTEAQWEYGCRAGTSTPWWTGPDAEFLSKATNIEGEVGSTMPVGSYLPNAFGLHDVHGNVWEWCQDKYPLSVPAGSSCHINRGGSFFFAAVYARSANRTYNTRSFTNHSLGLRPARTILP